MAVLLLFGIYQTTLFYLRQQGIYFDSLQVSWSAHVQLQGIHISGDGYLIFIRELETDLTWSNLIRGRYTGNRFHADQVLISTGGGTVDPEDTSSFSYAHVPYLNFEEVTIKRAVLRMKGTRDTSYMTFPYLRARNFNFNERIKSDSLLYHSGNWYFSMLSDSDSTEVSSSTEVEVPTGIPKFDVSYFELSNAEMRLATDTVVAKLSQMGTVIKGLNNERGADLDVQKFQLTFQDSVHVVWDAKRLEMINDSAVVMDAFELEFPDFQLRIKEFRQEEQGSSLTVEKLRLKPALLNWLYPANSVFRKDAPAVELGGTVSWTDSSIVLRDVDCSMGEFARFELNGSLSEWGRTNIVRMQVDPVQLRLADIDRMLVEPLTDEYDLLVLAHIEVSGNLDKLSLKGKGSANETNFRMTGSYEVERQLAVIELMVPLLETDHFLKEQNHEINGYGMHLSCRSDLGKLQSMDDLTLHIEGDSVEMGAFKLRQPTMAVRAIDGQTAVRMNAQENEWELRLLTNDNLLKENDIHFKGNLEGMIRKPEEPSLAGGKMEVSFTSEVVMNEENLHLGLDADNVKLTSANGRSYQSDLSLLLDQNRDRYALQVISGANTLSATWEEALFDWLGSENRTLQALPRARLNAKWFIDTSLVKELTGMHIGGSLDTLSLAAVGNKWQGELKLKDARYNEFALMNGKVTQDGDQLLIRVERLQVPYTELDKMEVEANLHDWNHIPVSVSFELPEIKALTQLAMEWDTSTEEYRFSFAENTKQRIGPYEWEAYRNTGIRFTHDWQLLPGGLEVQSGGQMIAINVTDEESRVRVEHLEVGGVVSLFVPETVVTGELNAGASYLAKQEAWKVQALVNELIMDSVQLGEIRIDGEGEKSDYDLQGALEFPFGSLHASVKPCNGGHCARVELNELNLADAKKITWLGLQSDDLQGKLTGEMDVRWADALKMKGELNVRQLEYTNGYTGANVRSKELKIDILEDRIGLVDGICTNKQSDTARVNATYHYQTGILNAAMVSERFALVDKKDRNAELQGNLDVGLDLQLQGMGRKWGITGTCMVPEGGAIEYYSKGSVELKDRDAIIQFVPFNEEQAQRVSVEYRPIVIDWDVRTTIESTDIYVLLSKTNHEYLSVTAFGELDLKDAGGTWPAVYGELRSNEGKVYYEAPMVSNVEMEIVLARLKWMGNAWNPVITFKGTETFRVTPNEMFADLSDKSDKVPVHVLALVDERPLEEFVIHFDLNSDNQQVQDKLNAAAPETRETYAMNMLIFGRINMSAEKVSSSYDGLVSKLNELSRRNLKNAELSFHVDNYANVAGSDVQEGVEKLGYQFSKGFLNKRMKLTVGGDIALGKSSDTEHGKSHLLGNVGLEYQLSRKPDIELHLQRSSSYNGPIEGEVERSSIGIGFELQFDNLFRSAKKEGKEAAK